MNILLYIDFQTCLIISWGYITEVTLTGHIHGSILYVLPNYLSEGINLHINSGGYNFFSVFVNLLCENGTSLLIIFALLWLLERLGILCMFIACLYFSYCDLLVYSSLKTLGGLWSGWSMECRIWATYYSSARLHDINAYSKEMLKSH